MKYYVKLKSGVKGPFSKGRLKELTDQGKIDGDTLISSSPQGPWSFLSAGPSETARTDTPGGPSVPVRPKTLSRRKSDEERYPGHKDVHADKKNEISTEGVRRPCRFCGESVIEGAVKCPHCRSEFPLTLTGRKHYGSQIAHESMTREVSHSPSVSFKVLAVLAPLTFGVGVVAFIAFFDHPVRGLRVSTEREHAAMPATDAEEPVSADSNPLNNLAEDSAGTNDQLYAEASKLRTRYYIAAMQNNFEYGIPNRLDLVRAEELSRLAAENGHLDSMYLLGNMLEEGDVNKDSQQAREWFSKCRRRRENTALGGEWRAARS